MTFFQNTMPFIVALATLSALSACGGAPEAESGMPEKTVENRMVEPTSSLEASAMMGSPASSQAAPSPEFAALPAPYDGGDYARGRRTFKLCQSCHSVSEGGQNLVGPKLHGLFGRDVGSVEGFDYSDALSGADFTWTPQRLDEWLANPRAFLPGNKMSFSGVRKPEDRLAVIAYIMVESGYERSPE